MYTRTETKQQATNKEHTTKNKVQQHIHHQNKNRPRIKHKQTT